MVEDKTPCDECGHPEHRYGPIGAWTFGGDRSETLSEPSYLPMPCPAEGCSCGEEGRDVVYA